MNPKPSAEIYTKYLSENGYSPEVDKDGDVRFKKEGENHYIIINEDDPGYFQIMRPLLIQIKTKEDLERVKAGALAANEYTKVIKVLVMEDQYVSVSCELFVAQREDFKPVFERCLRAISAGVKKFDSVYNPQTQAAQPA